MNRCVVKMLNGNPVGIITKPNGVQRSLTGRDLIRYLGRIDESLIKRRVCKNPFIKNDGQNITYISKLLKKNIRIENSPETLNALYDLYLEDRKENSEYFKRYQEMKKKAVIRRAAVYSAIAIGGGALGIMAHTANKDIDLQYVATYDAEAIREENAKELAVLMEDNDVKVIDTTVENNSQNIETDVVSQVQEISEDEILSIVGTPTHVEVEGVYDKGIEDNIEYLKDIIKERGNRWGVDPELIHDIISQESSGGKYDQVGQFEFSAWKNPITVHNFDTNQDVTVVFSNDPEQWAGKVDMVITQQDLENVKTQVSVTAIVLQYYFNLYNHNIPLAIQAYNRGQPNIDELIRKTAVGEGITTQDLTADQNNLSWIGYAWTDETGLTYFQQVAKHISEAQQEDGINDAYEMAYVDNDGNVQIQTFQAQVNVKNK